MKFNKFSLPQTSILLLLYLLITGVLFYSAIPYGDIKSKALIIVLILFITYIFYDELFNKTYEVNVDEHSLSIRSWGQMLLGRNVIKTIPWSSIKNLRLASPGTEIGLFILVTLEGGKSLRIGCNYFRLTEFGRLKQELKKRFQNKFVI